MAGSKLNFLYTSDSGANYVVSLDESNTKAVNGVAGALTAANSPGIGVPRNIKVREIFYEGQGGARIIRVVPLTPAVYTALLTPPFATLPDPIDDGAPALNLSRARGERRSVPRVVDTGLDDGTTDNP